MLSVPVYFLLLVCCVFSISSAAYWHIVSGSLLSSTFSSAIGAPSAIPSVRGDGAGVLQPIGGVLQGCSVSDRVAGASEKVLDEAEEPEEHAQHAQRHTMLQYECDTKKRNAFVCAAKCAAREPQLERSLAPWASWSGNNTGTDMLDTFMGFCKQEKTCQDPFVIFTLWDGQVHLRACGGIGPGGEKDAPGLNGLLDPSLYLIGPEDLSLALILFLGVQSLATLPKHPIVFGMYLSDYSCLLDRHLVGPGLPIFAYLTRDTSWLIPFPSSFTLKSTQDVEQFQKQSRQGHSLVQEAPLVPWSKRRAQAYWIGAVTGPWEFTPDAGLMAVPRLNLLHKTAQHPAQLHAEWSNLASYGISWVHDTENVSGFLAHRPRGVEELTGIKKSGRKELVDWSDYKYYINLDGVVMGGRLNKLLSQGGVVLQHQSGYYEFYEALLEPYKHYVPVAYDLSDLVPKVKWLQENEENARKIASRSRSLASQRLRFEDQLCYIWRALEGIGAKTSNVAVNPAEMRKKLEGDGFIKVSFRESSFRTTLEHFWGQKLEDVRTGERRMLPKGIELLQWAWERVSGLRERAHGGKM